MRPSPPGSVPADAGRASLAGAALGAVGFLTTLPVSEERAARGHGAATAFFPLVGWGIGSLAAVLLWAVPDPLLGGALVVPALALATGGLHWDGLADVMDAGLARVTMERRREILHDSRVGAHAVWGVATLALLQVVALSGSPWWAVAAGPALGRWAMVASLAMGPPPPDSVVGARFRSRARPGWATVVMAVSLGLFLWAAPARVPVLVGLGCALVGGWVAGVFLFRRLGGLNGDAHGAVGLVVEAAFWVGLALAAGDVA